MKIGDKVVFNQHYEWYLGGSNLLEGKNAVYTIISISSNDSDIVKLDRYYSNSCKVTNNNFVNIYYLDLLKDVRRDKLKKIYEKNILEGS